MTAKIVRLPVEKSLAASREHGWAQEKAEDLLFWIQALARAGVGTENLRPLAFAATKVAAYINGTEWTVEQATDLLKVDP